MRTRNLRNSLAIAGIVMGAALATPALSATNYWDTNGAAAGFGTASGTWGVDGNWSGDATGATAPAVTNTTAADDLFLGTGALGLGAGTVTVSGTNQTFKTLTFGAASGAITVTNGSLAVASSGSTVQADTAYATLASGLTGTGRLDILGTRFTMSVTNNAFLPGTPTTTTIVPNALLSDVTDVGGYLGGPFVGTPIPASVFFLTNRGDSVTFQLQIVQNQIKCAGVKLTQSGNNILATLLYSGYVAGANGLGYDFDTQPYTSYAYGVTGMVVTVTNHSPKLFLSGTNTITGGVVISNSIVEVNGTVKALPGASNIVVNAGSELILNVAGAPWGNTTGVGGAAPLVVNRARLTNKLLSNIGNNRSLTLDGSVLYNEVNNQYLNSLNLMNGASVTGSRCAVGYADNGVWSISGTSPSSVATDIQMVAPGKYLNLNVADVTGDAAADLVISGRFVDYGVNNSAWLWKTGAGTVSLTGASTWTYYLRIDEGTVALNRTNALNTSNHIRLNGGTLDMGSFSNALNTLTVTANSTLKLGSGQLLFADSHTNVWSGNLTLTNTLGKTTLRFGTNSTALTAGQLGMIRNDGRPVIIDANGYILQAPRGTLISFF